jgi:hypothetical protein
MGNPYKNWKNLFLFCFGLFAAAAFCMKWMETDFMLNGNLFTIIGLEIGYPKEKVISVLSGLDDHVRTILRYHLSFDFVFMAGVYPGIAALCMMARIKSSSKLIKRILITGAILQAVAWGCDIAENFYLFGWIRNPVIGNEFGLYHFIVAAKWVIALSTAMLAIPLALRKRKHVLKS